MAGESDLGDLIVTLKLDDQQYREDIKEAVYLTTASIKKIQAELAGEKAAHLAAASAGKVHAAALTEVGNRALSATGQIKVINAKAQEAHQRFGVMANAVTGASTTLRLFGLESGFAAVESGRMVLYLGRALTAAGGFAAGLKIVAMATVGFVTSMHPLVFVAGIAAVAYALLRRRTDDLAESTAKLRAEESQLVENRAKISREATIEAAVIRGTISDTDVRRMKLQGPGPLAAWEHEEVDRIMRDQDFIAETKRKNLIIDRVQALRLESSILRGEGTQYDLIADSSERIATMERDRLKTLKELEKRRDELVARDQEGGGFGIGTLPSSGFRFGAGAIGSVIGEQTETKKTNVLLEKSLQKLDAQIVELRKLTEPSTSDN